MWWLKAMMAQGYADRGCFTYAQLDGVPGETQLAISKEWHHTAQQVMVLVR